MSMERRVGFTLTKAQIVQACEEYVAARLLPDEEAAATLFDKDGAFIGAMTCEIAVSKKRKPRSKKNGDQP
jgi:hypothetical protein